MYDRHFKQNQAHLQANLIEDDRTGLNIPTLRRAIADNLLYLQGKFPSIATTNDYYLALAYTIRDRLLQRWIATSQTYIQEDVRVVCYLSAEFLVDPHLANNHTNAIARSAPAKQIAKFVRNAGLAVGIQFTLFSLSARYAEETSAYLALLGLDGTNHYPQKILTSSSSF
ncbi:MAG: hypothetical protein QNJ53_03050 [Pleurocapsa sp. MO_192.B19]|nr:hypothetical protein [Pleurocapsa sp. MO_192.B19]